MIHNSWSRFCAGTNYNAMIDFDHEYTLRSLPNFHLTDRFKHRMSHELQAMNFPLHTSWLKQCLALLCSWNVLQLTHKWGGTRNKGPEMSYSIAHSMNKIQELYFTNSLDININCRFLAPDRSCGKYIYSCSYEKMTVKSVIILHFILFTCKLFDK